MPYITPLYRPHIDTAVTRLVKTIHCNSSGVNGDLADHAGALNYAITKLILTFLGEPSYWKLALIKGVLTDVRDEFNRRVVTPYEEGKREANGDVY